MKVLYSSLTAGADMGGGGGGDTFLSFFLPRTEKSESYIFH